MKKYKEVCNKLKGKEVKMSNVRSALLEIAGGSRDVLLQIKSRSTGKGTVVYRTFGRGIVACCCSNNVYNLHWSFDTSVASIFKR